MQPNLENFQELIAAEGQYDPKSKPRFFSMVIRDQGLKHLLGLFSCGIFIFHFIGLKFSMEGENGCSQRNIKSEVIWTLGSFQKKIGVILRIDYRIIKNRKLWFTPKITDIKMKECWMLQCYMSYICYQIDGQTCLVHLPVELQEILAIFPPELQEDWSTSLQNYEKFGIFPC